MKLIIGLSYAPKDAPKTQNYLKALEHAAYNLGDDIELIDLYSMQERAKDADGIVFTGGSDVDPSRYGKSEAAALCDIDSQRDESEFALAERADKERLPVFAICRGLQLMNVHYGGTLTVDLERAGFPSHSKIDGVDRGHEVHVEPGTALKRLTRATDTGIASAHHQAIEQLAPGMQVSATSKMDDVIEAIEWQDPKGKPYFLAVQWHPERMDYENPLAGELFEGFLLEVAMNKLIKKRL